MANTDLQFDIYNMSSAHNSKRALKVKNYLEFHNKHNLVQQQKLVKEILDKLNNNKRQRGKTINNIVGTVCIALTRNRHNLISNSTKDFCKPDGNLVIKTWQQK